MKRPGGFDGGQDPLESAADQVTERSRAPREPIRLPEWRLQRRAEPEATGNAPETDAPRASEALAETSPGRHLGIEPEVEPDRVRAAQRDLKRAQRSVRRRERGEQRRFTEHLRRRRRTWLIAVGAVLALALFVAVGVLSPLTAVREVRIVGAAQVDEAALQTALARFEGVPLALVSEQEVHRALEPFPLIQRYAIERIPPHTLILRIEERDAVVAVSGDDVLQLLDPAGVLVGTATERPLGVPLASGQVAVVSSPAFAAAAQVVRDLPDDLRAQLAEVSASSAQDVSFILTGGTRVVWGEATETQRKALVLRSVLAAVGAVSMIDVSSPSAPVFQ